MTSCWRSCMTKPRWRRSAPPWPAQAQNSPKSSRLPLRRRKKNRRQEKRRRQRRNRRGKLNFHRGGAEDAEFFWVGAVSDPRGDSQPRKSPRTPRLRGALEAFLVVRLVVRRSDRALELELGHSDLHDVAVAQEPARRLLAVDQHAVLRAQVDDLELVVVDRHARVLARDRAVHDADAVLRTAAQRDDLADQRPRLALRPGALLHDPARLRRFVTEPAKGPTPPPGAVRHR